MRQDIAHVANMSHHGSERTSKKYGGRVNYVSDPDHLYDDEVGGIHPASRRRGWINLNHSPITGFLNKNLGRPWDDVYSEFCAVTDTRTLLGRDLRKAILSNVEIGNIYEGADGKVYEYRAGVLCDRGEYDSATHKYTKENNPTYWLAKDTPVSGYYVHPRTGILCEAKGGSRHYYSQFDYTQRRQPPKPIEMIVLQKDYVERSHWFGAYQSLEPSEYYQRELCGKKPRNRFHAWFHYVKKTTVETSWQRVDGSAFAKNAHFEGVEVAPYVDPVKERYYRARPDKYEIRSDGFWYVLVKKTNQKLVKRTCNRADLKIVREYLAKRAG